MHQERSAGPPLISPTPTLTNEACSGRNWAGPRLGASARRPSDVFVVVVDALTSLSFRPAQSFAWNWGRIDAFARPHLWPAANLLSDSVCTRRRARKQAHTLTGCELRPPENLSLLRQTHLAKRRRKRKVARRPFGAVYYAHNYLGAAAANFLPTLGSQRTLPLGPDFMTSGTAAQIECLRAQVAHAQGPLRAASSLLAQLGALDY